MSYEGVPEMPAESSEKSFKDLEEVFKQELEAVEDLLRDDPDIMSKLLDKLKGDLGDARMEDKEREVKSISDAYSQVVGGSLDKESALKGPIERSSFSDDLKEKLEVLMLQAIDDTNNAASEEMGDEI